MQIADLKSYLTNEVSKYTGPGTLYFGAGTSNELNAFEQIKETTSLGYPIVWLFEDPEMLNIRGMPNFRKELQFNIAVLFQSSLDAPPSETEDCYRKSGLIGEGIAYNLANRNEYSGLFLVTGWQQAHRLKIQDNVLTGTVVQITATAPMDVCDYPFESAHG